MKLCACVIIYHPDLELLKKNILAYYDYVGMIVLWLNSDLDYDKSLKAIDRDDKIEILKDESGVNRGISCALNSIVKFCLSRGYSYLLTMDQDSVFQNFDAYYKSVSSFASSHDDVIQFGPEINETKIEPGTFKPCNYVITSGAIINLFKTMSIGCFRNDFFVDGIDLDFGFKANKKGFKVYQVGGAILTQNFGETHVKRGKKIISYSPKRLHDTIETQIILWREYPTYFHKFLFLKIYYLYTPLNILIYQDEKWEKLKAIVRGTIDGLRYRIVK